MVTLATRSTWQPARHALRLLAQLEHCVRRALERSPRTLSTDASAASCLPYRVRRLQEDQLVEWLPGAMLVSGLI